MSKIVTDIENHFQTTTQQLRQNYLPPLLGPAVFAHRPDIYRFSPKFLSYYIAWHRVYHLMDPLVLKLKKKKNCYYHSRIYGLIKTIDITYITDHNAFIGRNAIGQDTLKEHSIRLTHHYRFNAT